MKNCIYIEQVAAASGRLLNLSANIAHFVNSYNSVAVIFCVYVQKKLDSGAKTVTKVAKMGLFALENCVMPQFSMSRRLEKIRMLDAANHEARAIVSQSLTNTNARCIKVKIS